MNNMLFAPKEQGQGMIEFAVVLGLLALAFMAVTKFWNMADASKCGAIEHAMGQC